MADYRCLIRQPPDETANWVRVEFPEGVNAQWIGAMLDIAITDYYAVNESPEVIMESRLRLAAALLKLADEASRMRKMYISDWYMKFSRKAIEEGFVNVPPAMTADAVARRALRCFELTREQALTMAAERRHRYNSALDSGLSAEEFTEEISQAEYGKLVTIEHILQRLLWFAGKITDDRLEDEVQAWFEASGQLGLGKDIARKMHARSFPGTTGSDDN